MFLERFIRFKQSKVAAVVRVSTYFACVAVAGATLTTQRAKADMTEQGFVLGRDLSKIAEFVDHTYEVRMNGETIYMAMTDSSLSRKEILDRYDEVCRNNPGLIAQEWQKVPQASGPANRAGDGTLLTRLGVMRKETDKEGMVACLAKPEKESAGLSDAFNKFMQTGELGYVGKLRYAYVSGPTQSGRYNVTTMWTEGSFNLNKLMGGDGTGDAPGTDSPTAGRPPSAKRFLSAEIIGTPYAIRLYDSQATPETVYAKYDATMFNDDWLVFNQYGEGAHIYFKDGVETIVSAVKDNDGKTVISVGEFGGDRLAAVQ